LQQLAVANRAEHQSFVVSIGDQIRILPLQASLVRYRPSEGHPPCFLPVQLFLLSISRASVLPPRSYCHFQDCSRSLYQKCSRACKWNGSLTRCVKLQQLLLSLEAGLNFCVKSHLRDSVSDFCTTVSIGCVMYLVSRRKVTRLHHSFSRRP
jgi:hypothetical protein